MPPRRLVLSLIYAKMKTKTSEREAPTAAKAFAAIVSQPRALFAVRYLAKLKDGYAGITYFKMEGV